MNTQKFASLHIPFSVVSEMWAAKIHKWLNTVSGVKSVQTQSSSPTCPDAEWAFLMSSAVPYADGLLSWHLLPRGLLDGQVTLHSLQAVLSSPPHKNKTILNATSVGSSPW